MNKIFFLLLLLPAFAVAQPYTYTFSDISGKWVEQTRTDKNSDVTPFKDTLYIEIREDGFMMVRHAIGATYYGDAELVENKLSIQNDHFTIESNENNILKLKKGKYTHRFVKQAEFNDSPVAKVIPGVEKGQVLDNFEDLNGKWSVYKKTDPNFDRKKFYIKTLDIKEKNMKGLFSGLVTFHNMDSVYSDNATVKIQDKEISILSSDKVLKMTILKNDGEELILEHGSISYFLKRFGR